MGLNIDSEKLQGILLGKYSEAKEEYLDRKNLSEITSELKASSERYLDSTEIAHGGMKTIYKVYDKLTDRQLALARPKIKDDENFKEYFLREARLTASLQHPNIMPIHDIGCDENEDVFFTMTLVEGKNLAEILFSKEKHKSDINSLHDYLNMFLKICDAVSHAHDKGIVHLDLKPANIQIGDHGEVLLCDWGVSKILFHECEEEILFKKDLEISSLNMTLANRGTPGYMAPEQFTKDKTDRQTDIYALGGVLYSILTYEHPLKKADLKEMEKATVHGNIVTPSKRSPNNFIPVSLEAICLKALSTDKEERYHSVDGLKAEIQAYFNGFATEAENASFSTQFALFIKRNKKIVFVISAAVLIMLFSALFFIIELSKKERQTAKALEQSIESENKTKTALQKLQEEKASRIEAEQTTAFRFAKQASQYLQDANFPKALALAEKALQFDPQSPESLRVKVRVLLALHEFEDAVETASKIPEDRYEIIFKSCKAAIDSLSDENYPTVETLMIVSRYFYPTSKSLDHSLYQKVLEKNYQALSGNDKKIYIKKLICSLNPGLKLDEIIIKFEHQSLVINSNKLKKLPYLNGANLKRLDLSYSDIEDTGFASTTKLYSLSLSHCKNVNFRSSDIAGIKALDISNTKISGFPRHMSGIENLNITGTRINDYSRLIHLKKLKQLTIKKQQIPQDILKLLKCEVLEL